MSAPTADRSLQDLQDVQTTGRGGALSHLQPSHSAEAAERLLIDPASFDMGNAHDEHHGEASVSTLASSGLSSIDETTFAHRTSALRQLYGSPRLTIRSPKQRQSRSTNTRSSLSSQPVLVRAYSGSSSSTAMPSRPSSSSNSRRSRRPVPRLPAQNDFTIDNILLAIEPDIRSTLDAIAEICGKSRLSLANEYGSHLPPQGIIRAGEMGHSLMPVEEASASTERLATVTSPSLNLHDDDASTLDGESRQSSSRNVNATSSSPWGSSSSTRRDGQDDLPTGRRLDESQTKSASKSLLRTKHSPRSRSSQRVRPARPTTAEGPIRLHSFPALTSDGEEQSSTRRERHAGPVLEVYGQESSQHANWFLGSLTQWLSPSGTDRAQMTPAPAEERLRGLLERHMESVRGHEGAAVGHG